MYKAIFGNMPKRQHDYRNSRVIQQKLPTNNKNGNQIQ